MSLFRSRILTTLRQLQQLDARVERLEADRDTLSAEVSRLLVDSNYYREALRSQQADIHRLTSDALSTVLEAQQKPSRVLANDPEVAGQVNGSRAVTWHPGLS